MTIGRRRARFRSPGPADSRHTASFQAPDGPADIAFAGARGYKPAFVLACAPLEACRVEKPCDRVSGRRWPGTHL